MELHKNHGRAYPALARQIDVCMNIADSDLKRPGLANVLKTTCMMLVGLIFTLSNADAETIPAISLQVIVKPIQTYYDKEVKNSWDFYYYSGKLSSAAAVGTSFCAAALTSGAGAYDPSLGLGGYCTVASADESNGIVIVNRSCRFGCIGRLDTGPYFGCPDGSTWNGSACVTSSYSCPATGGWTLSSDQQSCTRPDCPAGYDRDPNTGACLAPCLAGQERNLSTMQCETSCPSPLIRTEGNTCNCPAPLTLTDDNACVGSEDKNLGSEDCRNTPSATPVLE